MACVSTLNAADEQSGGAKPGTQATSAPTAPSLDPQALVRMAPNYDIWVDPKRKLVVVDGKVVLREGFLEMFACPAGTKEHESIVAVNCNAQFVHSSLVALGAEPGHPVRFVPEYRAASGPVVDVWVVWKDERGMNQTVRAQEWIQQSKTNKPMEHAWVFGGSGFLVDETTGKRHYLADGGDFICVSNFTSALLDLPVTSSQSNEELSFRAYTEKIPPVGTAVRLVLQPRLVPSQPVPGPNKKAPLKPVPEKPAALPSPAGAG
jgi:hypothetical protein